MSSKLTRAEVAAREMRRLGQYYRNDWSDFDGRTLRYHLDALAEWLTLPFDKDVEEFTNFSEMLEEQEREMGL